MTDASFFCRPSRSVVSFSEKRKEKKTSYKPRAFEKKKKKKKKKAIRQNPLHLSDVTCMRNKTMKCKVRFDKNNIFSGMIPRAFLKNCIN